MRRIPSRPREDWERRVESQGFLFHSIGDEPYWDESAFYWFTRQEIDEIEAATYALNEMTLAAVQHVIDNGLWENFRIAPEFRSFILESWEKDDQTVYGRFDLCYNGQDSPRLLEYNADTPTSLLEAAVVQWYWMKDTQGGDADQFNSIHERLIETWRAASNKLGDTLYFASLSLEDSVEDFITVNYLRDTAMQAGFNTGYIEIQQLGWDERRQVFTDQNESPIHSIFKLYPWEWMVREEFGRNLQRTAARVNWLEPPWKMLLSNKAILPVLYQLYPTSPYLLHASHYAVDLPGAYVRKPILGREGSNISIVENARALLETPGPYGSEGVIYQEFKPLPEFDGRYPVIGSWMVNGYACGMGIREDDSLITQNTSHFLPHLFGDDQYAVQSLY